jgi:PIN domain nuclease of toxin-antitoxin system
MAYFYQEPGADVVESAILQGSFISTINWAEVLSTAIHRGEDIDELISKIESANELSRLTILPAIEIDAIQIARLRPATKTLGLSLGDRACLALGLRLDLTVLTADQIWKNLALNIPITIIRP